MHPTQAAMERLAEAGFITKTTSEEDGDTNYGVSDPQAERLLPILKRPSMWEESPILSQCKEALQALREHAIQNGDIEGDGKQ